MQVPWDRGYEHVLANINTRTQLIIKILNLTKSTAQIQERSRTHARTHTHTYTHFQVT